MKNFFDLKIVSDLLKNSTKHKRLAFLIDQAAWIGDLRYNLEITMDCINQIIDLSKSRFNAVEIARKNSTLDGALASQAILQYCKVTSVYDVKKIFDEKQKKSHREIIEIRNKYLAHLEKKDHENGIWWESQFYISFDTDTRLRQINVYSARSNYRGAVVQNLLDLSIALDRDINDKYINKAKMIDEYILNNDLSEYFAQAKYEGPPSSKIDSCWIPVDNSKNPPSLIEYFHNINDKI